MERQGVSIKFTNRNTGLFQYFCRRTFGKMFLKFIHKMNEIDEFCHIFFSFQVINWGKDEFLTRTFLDFQRHFVKWKTFSALSASVGDCEKEWWYTFYQTCLPCRFQGRVMKSLNSIFTIVWFLRFFQKNLKYFTSITILEEMF